MSITHVKHLQEALARFSPDARLSCEVDVQGPSPATDCVITAELSEDSRNKMERLEEGEKEMELEITDLRLALAAVREQAKLIGVSKVRSAIEEIVEKEGI